MKNIIIEIKKNEEKIVPFIYLARDVDKKIIVRLLGEGASVHIIGIFIGKKNNLFNFQTQVIHEAPHSKSKTTIRAVLINNSAFNNDGLIHVMKGAKGADGYFASKILLFDNAKGKSIPSLEIDENDLKAGHASTVGKPDQDQIFYLQSKGLSKKEAEKLIVSGFFQPVIGSLPINQQKKITKQIAQLL